MKTRNSNLQKTGLETLAVMALLITTSFTLGAQGAGYITSLSYNTELALTEAVKYAPVPTATSLVKADRTNFSDYLTEDVEEETAIEDWMTDAAYFGVTLEADVEEGMKVEDWMTDDFLFESAEVNTTNKNSTVEKEVKNPKTVGVTFPKAQFGRRAFILVEMQDPALELEAWMVDQKIWNSVK